MLPSIFCPGAPKAGSSYLCSILLQSPDIFFGADKEGDFFSRRSLAEVKSAFARYELIHFRDYDGQKFVADFDPGYLHHADPEVMKAFVGPDVKMIVTVRNPAYRAFSEYHHSCQAFVENRSFTDSVEDKENIISLRSFYADYIERFIRVFGRENFLFLVFEEDIVGDPGPLTSQLIEFLDLPPFDMDPAQLFKNPTVSSQRRFLFHGDTEFEASLGSEIPKGGAVCVRDNQIESAFTGLSALAMGFLRTMENNLTKALDSEMAVQLNNKIFRQDIERTQDLIGRDLSGWLKGET